LSPQLSEETKILFYVLGELFEIVIGLWLLLKGINVEKLGKRNPEPISL